MEIVQDSMAERTRQVIARLTASLGRSPRRVSVPVIRRVRVRVPDASLPRPERVDGLAENIARVILDLKRDEGPWISTEPLIFVRVR